MKYKIKDPKTKVVYEYEYHNIFVREKTKRKLQGLKQEFSMPYDKIISTLIDFYRSKQK